MSAELLLLHCRAAMKPEAIKLSIAITLLHPQLPTPTVHVSGECVCYVSNLFILQPFSH